MLFQKKVITEKMFNYPVQINWDHQDGKWWNECCADVIEVFGLPGNKFMYRPHTDYMVFEFKSKKDADLCKILLSEKL